MAMLIRTDKEQIICVAVHGFVANDHANLPGAAGQRKQGLPKSPPGSTGSG
jgi:hypothetical protein